MSDPDSVESLWESVERNLEYTRPEPTGLDPAVRDEHDGSANNDQEDEHPGTLETHQPVTALRHACSVNPLISVYTG